MTSKMRQLLLLAQHGDEPAREKFIKKYRNFVAGVCSRECNRRLAWENDEELSVGLLALNEAINTFDVKAEVKFTTFACIVIKRRLIDYFRYRSKYEKEILVSFHDWETRLETELHGGAMNTYSDALARDNLSYLLGEYGEKLSRFNIVIGELPGMVPKSQEKLNILHHAARALAKDKKMAEHLLGYGQLPVKQLCKSTGLSRKVVEKRRKLIIALAVLLLDPQLSSLLAAAFKYN